MEPQSAFLRLPADLWDAVNEEAKAQGVNLADGVFRILRDESITTAFSFKISETGK